MIRLVIHGANGRMGARLRDLAPRDGRFTIAAAVDRDGPIEGGEALRAGAFDVVIDVSTDAGARDAIALARAARSAVLVATTGLSPDTLGRADDAAADIPVMIAANTSVGVAVLAHLARQAAKLLGESYDVSLVEHHHAAKKDAPSGTALRLAEAVQQATGRSIDPRNILAARGGDIVGEHSLRFCGPGEYLELTHRATTRDLFVLGALRAAAHLSGRPPGRYTIEQAIGLT